MATHDPARRSTPEPAIPRDRPASESAIDVLFRDEAEFETARPRHARTTPARDQMTGIEVIPILPSDQVDAAAFPDEVDLLEERSSPPVLHTPQLAESYTPSPRPGAADRYTTPRAGATRAPRKRFASAAIAAIGVAALLVLAVAAGVSVLRRTPAASAPPPVNHADVQLPAPVKAESLGTTGAVALPDQPVAPLPEPGPVTPARQAPLTLEENPRPVMEPRAYATVRASEERIAPASPVTVPESPRLTPLALPDSTVATSAVPAPPPAAPSTVERPTPTAPPVVESAPAPAPAPPPVVNEAAAIRVALSRFAAGYSDLDPAAVSAVWPSVDRAGLSRAFSTLDAQQLTFDRCDIQVNGSVGNATCVGTAMWMPKIGGQTRELARTWKFVLKNGAGTWQIVTAESR